MAHRTMPILYLNLCGEMLYIIDQRLIDTKTDPEKQIKGTNISSAPVPSVMSKNVLVQQNYFGVPKSFGRFFLISDSRTFYCKKQRKKHF